jgi:uncharacterized membrane protein
MAGRSDGRRWWTLLAFFLVHGFIIAVPFRTIYTTRGISGVGLFFKAANRLLAGQVPYRDYLLEYPPAALVFFTLPRVAGERFSAYYNAFDFEVFCAQAVILLLLFLIARKRNEEPAIMLAAYTVFVLAAGPIVIQQFDIFPAALALAAVYCYSRRRFSAAAAMLALGTLTKVYPLLLAPVFAIPLWRRRSFADLRRGAIAFFATTIVALLPLLIVAPTALRSFLGYHTSRGIQIESTYGSLVLVVDKLGLITAGIGMSFGSWNVSGLLADALVPISAVLLAAAVAWALIRVNRVAAAGSWELVDDTSVIALASLLVIGCGLLASKVLSPQYLIWLLPFVPLVPAAARRTVWPLFVVIGILTYYIFPTNYIRLVYDDAATIAVLVLRNLLLVLFTWRCARELRGIPPNSAAA